MSILSMLGLYKMTEDVRERHWPLLATVHWSDNVATETCESALVKNFAESISRLGQQRVHKKTHGSPAMSPLVNTLKLLRCALQS